MTDLAGAVLATADEHPDLIALTAGGDDLTYRALGEAIRASAHGLLALGLKRGDRVLFSVRPGRDAVVLALAIIAAGGVVVFADPGAGAPLFEARSRLATPRFVAAESLLYAASTPLLRPVARRRGLELADYRRLVPGAQFLRSGRWLPGVPRGAVAIKDLPARGADRGDDLPEARERDEALVIFTSGTTAVPKGVVHGRLSLGSGLSDFAAGVGLRPGQRVLTDQLMVGVPALIAGAHWTIPAAGLDPAARPAAYLDALPQAQVLFAVPAAMDALLRELAASSRDLPELETIILGGAPVLRPLLARIHERFPHAAIRGVYGMTEILPVAISDGVAKLHAPVTAGDHVGRIMPSVRARIVDGELVLAGAGLARGYLADLPEHPLAELRTGDLAEIVSGSDGEELVLHGRLKEMFIRGTQNVYPGLYEPVMAGIPGVADVAMVGLPDEIGDDAIAVVVVPKEDPPAELSADHPLVERVRRALPGLIDAGSLPDVVLAAPSLPTSGRSSKLDRAVLTALVQAWQVRGGQGDQP